MKPISNKGRNRGFTLLEVIIALVVASILAAMLVSFMGSGVVQSVNPVLQARNGAYLNQIMENMTADYKYLMSTDATPLNTFSTRVGDVNASRTQYSDAQHPYTIVEKHRISFPSGSTVTEQVNANGKILKVTIRYQDLTLTALFTE